MNITARKQGGALIMTIPAAIVKELHLTEGSDLSLKVSEEGFFVRPTVCKRYTLKELLRGATSKNLKALKKATQWAREGESVGRELT